MRLVEHDTELFRREPIGTEATAWRCLRERPLGADVSYLATSWSVRINQQLLEPVASWKRVARGFAICQHIRYAEVVPLLLGLGVDTLFTPHAARDATHGLRILPFPHVATNSRPPVARKDIWYSFVGAAWTHPCRHALRSLPTRRGAVIELRERWHFDETDPRSRELRRRQYVDVLSRSRYSLCPRGAGASTLRFWESLRAGAIPVLISDAVWLPEPFDWERCVVRVPEADVRSVVERLAAIDAREEGERRAATLRAYAAFSGTNFVNTVHHHYDGAAGRTNVRSHAAM
jgi:hypothetical protein